MVLMEICRLQCDPSLGSIAALDEDVLGASEF